MSQLTDAVTALRRHEEELTGLLNGLMGELNNIQVSVGNIKKSLASQRTGAPPILDALTELERIEKEYANAQLLNDDYRRRVAVQIFVSLKRLKSPYRIAHEYLQRADRDPILNAIAQDIKDRVNELVEDLAPIFGLKPPLDTESGLLGQVP